MGQTDVQIPMPQTSSPMSNDFNIDDILAGLQKAAGTDASTSPAGPGVGPIPIMPPQKAPRTAPEGITMGAQGHFSSRGEHKRATLGSLMGNITSIITKGIQNQQEKKARQVQFDMERIITIIQADPNIQNPQNQKILNDIAGDPKKLKAFQKALGIDFIKPDKNANTPERKGATAAFQSMQQGGQGSIPNTTTAPASTGGAQAQLTTQAQSGGLSPQAQQLVGMFPQGPRAAQLSPDEQKKAMMIKAGLIASADKRLEAITKVIDTNMRAQAQLNVAQLHQLGAMILAKARAESQLEDIKARIQGSKEVTQMKISADVQLEKLKHSQRMDEIVKRHDLSQKETSPEKKAQMLKEQDAMVGQIIKDDQLLLQKGDLDKDRKKAVQSELESMRSYRLTLIDAMKKGLAGVGVQSGATSATGLADEGANLLDESDDENFGVSP